MAVGLSLPLLGLTAASVFAQMIKISVFNNSGKTMTALYLSSVEDDWGENMLDGPIPDREKEVFEWNRAEYEGLDSAGCVFDVRVDYSDGKYTDMRGVNLCEQNVLNFK